MGSPTISTPVAVCLGFVFSCGLLICLQPFLNQLGLVSGLIGLMYVLTIIWFLRSSFAYSGPLILFVITLGVFITWRPFWASITSRDDLASWGVLSQGPIGNAGMAVYTSAVGSVALTIVCFIAFLLFTRKNQSGFQNLSLTVEEPAKVVWQCFFLVGACATAVRAVAGAGANYFESYINKPLLLQIPGLNTAASFLFLSFVWLVLFGGFQGRKRLVLLLVFILCSAPSLLLGSRGEVFCQWLVAAWLIGLAMNKRPSLMLTGLLFFSLAYLAEAVSTLRSNEKPLHLQWDQPALLVGEFLYWQGVSGQIVGSAVETLPEPNHSASYLLSPLANPIRRLTDTSFGTQSGDLAVGSGLLGHELAYALNSDEYFQGKGVGSSYIAESYLAAGLLGVVIATGCLIAISVAVPSLINYRQSFFFAACCATPYIIFTPRESFFFWIIPVIKAWFIYCFVNLFSNALRNRSYTHIQQKPFTSSNAANLPAARS